MRKSYEEEVLYVTGQSAPYEKPIHKVTAIMTIKTGGP